MKPAWTTVALGEVAKIERATVDPNKLPEETPYVGLENIEKGGRLLGISSISEAGITSSKFRFTSKHVLFGKLRPNLNKVATVNVDGVASTDILPILPSDRLDQRYLLHYLRQDVVKRKVSGLASGANLPRISPKLLGTIEVLLPPLDEQRRIAAVLDHVDALRDKRRSAMELGMQLPIALLDAVLSDGAERVRLGSLIEDGPKNGLYKPASAYGEGVPIIRIDSFKRGSGRVESKELKRLQITNSELIEYIVEEGDVVINRVNSVEHVGKAALAGPMVEPTVFESNMMRIRIDRTRAVPEFVNVFLQTQDARRQIAPKVKRAVNQASINQADVKSIEVPLLPVATQRAFADAMVEVDLVRAAAERHLAELDTLFAFLQSRAFAGELDVSKVVLPNR